MTGYTATWDMRDIIRGDTIKDVALILKDSLTGLIIVPDSVCCQIRDMQGNLIYQYDVQITAERVLLKGIPSTITSTWSKGVYHYDVEYTLQGVVRTYLKGKRRVLEDVSRCQTN